MTDAIVAAGRIPAPPVIPSRVDLEYREEPDAKTPQVERRCRGCGGSFKVLSVDASPPGSHAEAWRPVKDIMGFPGINCRGTPDPNDWSWCKVTGELTMPNRMAVRFFADRRKAPRSVDVDRRQPAQDDGDA